MSVPMQLWMEITDRDWDSLGIDINVRRYRDDGHVRLSATLAERMLPGDVVLHWWHAEQPSALVGWSVVVGHPEVLQAGVNPAAASPQTGHIPINAMITQEAYESHIQGTEVWLPLEWQAELSVTLEEVQAAAAAVIDLEQRMRARHGKDPLYFPFMQDGRGGLKGAWPHYLAAFPVDLLAMFPALPALDVLTTRASTAVRQNQANRTVNPLRTAAVDEHAARMTTMFMRDKGYMVIDVSAFEPYELLATVGQTINRVRVLASTGDFDSQSLLRQLDDRSANVLVVVDRIELVDDAFPARPGIAAHGGRLRMWSPWSPPATIVGGNISASTIPPPDTEVVVPEIVIAY